MSPGRRSIARSLGLRAATSLARLWQFQNKRQEAYDLLAPVYEWFTEGFGTADLQEVKALLEEKVFACTDQLLFTELRQGLRERGYTEGQNLVIEWRAA